MKKTKNLKVRICLLQNDVDTKELAKRMHVSIQTIYRWLSNEINESVQDGLCKVINGDYKMEDVYEIRIYFKKKALAEQEERIEEHIDSVIREVSDREFEAELEKEQEREQWLYDERRRR